MSSSNPASGTRRSSVTPPPDQRDVLGVSLVSPPYLPSLFGSQCPRRILRISVHLLYRSSLNRLANHSVLTKVSCANVWAWPRPFLSLILPCNQAKGLIHGLLVSIAWSTFLWHSTPETNSNMRPLMLHPKHALSAGVLLDPGGAWKNAEKVCEL